MDSLGDVLKNKKVPVEPAESRYIKAYVYEKYKEVITVLIQQHSLTIVVPNAGLAGTLRFDLPAIALQCNLTKKLYIRIS